MFSEGLSKCMYITGTGRQLVGKDSNKTLSEKDFINNVIDGELEDNKNA